MNLVTRINSKSFVKKTSFLLFWSVLMIGKGLGLNSNNEQFVRLVLADGVFAIICLTQSKWSKNNLLYFLLLVCLGGAIWLSSGNKDALLTFVVIFCALRLDIDKILKVTLAIRGGFFFAKTFLGIIGVLDKGVFYSYYEGVVRTRYVFGYVQPNAAHYEFFIVSVLVILCFKNKLKWFHYLAFALYNILLFIYTDSRTGFIMSMLLLGGSYFITKSNRKTIQLMASWTKRYYVLIITISFIICYLAATRNLFMGYGTLSSRLTTAIRVISSYKISLFGVQGIKTDFGFIYMLYANGVVFFALYIILNVKLAKIFRKKQCSHELFILLAYGLYTLLESYSSSILINMSLLFMSWVFEKQPAIQTRVNQ